MLMGSLIIGSLGGKLHNSPLTQAWVLSEAGYGIGLNSEQWSCRNGGIFGYLRSETHGRASLRRGVVNFFCFFGIKGLSCKGFLVVCFNG